MSSQCFGRPYKQGVAGSSPAPPIAEACDQRRRAKLAAYAIRYTYRMAKPVPAREFRSKLSEFLSDVADRRDHVLVTRNGRPAAALIPIDEYEALDETAEGLSDSAALDAIDVGLAEISRGETVELADLRRELAERRSMR